MHGLEQSRSSSTYHVTSSLELLPHSNLCLHPLTVSHVDAQAVNLARVSTVIREVSAAVTKEDETLCDNLLSHPSQRVYQHLLLLPSDWHAPVLAWPLAALACVHSGVHPELVSLQNFSCSVGNHTGDSPINDQRKLSYASQPQTLIVLLLYLQ
jgi:hypothetical protein